MTQCDNCGKKIGFFSSKHQYEDEEGNGLIYCSECNDAFEKKERQKEEKRQREVDKKQKEKKRLEIQQIQNNISKSLELVQKIFETEPEKEYAKKIISFFLKKKDIEYDEESPFVENDNVGYKAKVIKKLRELEILKKYSAREFILNINAQPEEDDEEEEEPDEEDYEEESDDDSDEEYTEDDEEEESGVAFGSNPLDYSAKTLKKIESGLTLYLKLKKK